MLLANRYKFVQPLGQGAMGVVSLVEDTTSAQHVALKVVSGEGANTAKAALRFKQEFWLATQLRHPNCCEVYDYGLLADGEPFFTMEVVEGHGLDERLPIDEETFRKLFPPLLLALGYIHQLGYVHCDLKAANVRVRPDGILKLMDYGLMDRAGSPGGIRGTLPYLSPEMAKGAPIDQRSDLYSLGILAYELLTGRQPFQYSTSIEMLKAHVSEPPLPPSLVKPHLPPALERIVLKLLAKEPIERYQSAYEVLEDLGVEVPAGIGGTLLTSPLVGRSPEISRLKEHMAAIEAGHAGGVLHIWGPSGIGKSRLVEEFRFAVQLNHLPYGAGTCQELNQAPYAPFVSVLRSLLPALREHVPAALESQAPVLVRLLPELGVEPAPEMDAPKKEMLRLHAAIAYLFLALAEKRGFVLTLENWHWADPLSRDLLHYLLRTIQEAPILFLLTSREEPDSAFAGLEVVQALRLPRLGTDELRKLITSMLGSEHIAPAFLAQVDSLSEGNPFYVERLLQHLVQDGLLVSEKGRWNTDIRLDMRQLPRSLNVLLNRKIAQLPASPQAIGRLGAVVGREMDLALLARVSGFSEEELFGALEALAGKHILARGEGGTYAFAQDQYQEIFYADLRPEEKQRLHAAIAEALEERLEGLSREQVPTELLTALASHCLEGGLRDKTLTYALEAGRRSAALFANADAERFLSAGLAAMATLPAPEQLRFEYLCALADVLRGAGQAESAVKLLVEAVPLAEKLGDQRSLGRLLTSLAKAHHMSDQYHEGLACCERSAAVCEANGDTAGTARALVARGRIFVSLGNIPEAIAAAERALALARGGADKGILGMASAFLGYLYVADGGEKLSEGVEHLNASIALLTEVGDKVLLNESYNLLGNAQNSLGDFAEALSSFQKNHALCIELGSRDEEAYALLNLATVDYELGDVTRGLQAAQAARAIAHELTAKMPVGMALVLEAVGLTYTGRLEAGLPLAQEALALARELQNRYLESLVLPYQLEILAHLGRLDEARAVADGLEALIRETGNTEPEGRLHAARAELLARRGELAAAREAAELAAREGTSAKGVRVRALKAKAWIALAAKDWETLKSVAEEALRLAEQIGCRQLAAELHGLLGEQALAVGTPGAEAHYQAMETLALELGLVPTRAIAGFGLAAAAPYAAGAQAQAAAARELLVQLLDGKPDDTRRAFLGLKERHRVWDGNYIEFSLPQRSRAQTGPLPELRFGFNRGLM